MRRLAMVSFTAALALALASPLGAAAATTVPGSLYSIGFEGTATEHLQWTSSGWSGEQNGTVNLVDSAALGQARLWLPAAPNSAEAVEQVAETAAPGFLQNPGGVDDAAALTEEGVGSTHSNSNVHYTCSAGTVNDEGIASISSAAPLGAIAVGTSYAGRELSATELHDDGGEWTCSNEELTDTPVFSAEAAINFAAVVPFGDVGQPSFSLPVTDYNTFNPCTSSHYLQGKGPGTTCSSSMAIAGNYAFTRVCGGTITYTATAVSGQCTEEPEDLELPPTIPTPPGQKPTEPPPPDKPKQGSGGAPGTKITKSKVSSPDDKAKFTFSGSGGQGRLSFQCKLDGKPFHTCKSPLTLTGLKPGHHTFEVRAVEAGGSHDASPAVARFEVD